MMAHLLNLAPVDMPVSETALVVLFCVLLGVVLTQVRPSNSHN